LANIDDSSHSMENKDSVFTPLAKLGEFGVIKHLTQGIKLRQPSSIVGIGDDAAVLDYSGKQVVVTTDLLTEGIHFNLIYTPLKHLGYKAAMVNFSDLFAMHATPRQLLISLAVSSKFSLEHLDELYSGLLLACDKYQVDLVGGDTNPSLTGLTISITALGDAEKNEPVFRNTANEGDLICVSGDLGAAYLGLQVLEREKKLFQENSNFQPSLENYDYVLERQLKPEARGDIIELLRKLKIRPTSMIDISDGLSSEVMHICIDSGKGCKIYEDKIPIDPDTARVAEELNLEPLTCALNGGEDYELLFTLPLKDFEVIRKQPKISVIGHICKKEEGMHMVTQTGELIVLQAQGWNGMQ
jgi:thiamine-monophosphate kinase